MFKNNRPSINTEQQKILKDLKRDGVALSTLDTLFPDQKKLEKLINYANTLKPEEAQQGRKTFLKKYWDKHPVLDLNNPFVEMTLSNTILDIVNSYMEQWSILKAYDLAKTLPVGENTDAVQSQRWHRDPEEKKMIKIFIYLNNVTEDAGPFIYAYGSQINGKYGHLFPQKTPLGIYPPDGSVESSIPKENIRKMTGPAGTVIFCNTAGLHKGGYATKNERIMFTSFFSASTFSEKPYYSIPQNLKDKIKKLKPEIQFALSQAH